MKDLYSIFKSITPENIQKIPVIKATMKIFIDNLNRNSSISQRIMELFNEDFRESDSKMLHDAKNTLKTGLYLLYANLLYKCIINVSQDRDMQKTLLKFGNTNAAILKEANLLINNEFFSSLRTFSQETGTNKALHYIYSFAKYLETGDTKDDLVIDESDPFIIHYEGELSKPFFEKMVYPMAHPTGWAYTYVMLQTQVLRDYFGVNVTYFVSKLEMVNLGEYIYVVFTTDTREKVVEEFKTKRINPRTKTFFTDKDLETQLIIWPHKEVIDYQFWFDEKDKQYRVFTFSDETVLYWDGASCIGYLTTYKDYVDGFKDPITVFDSTWRPDATIQSDVVFDYVDDVQLEKDFYITRQRDDDHTVRLTDYLANNYDYAFKIFGEPYKMAVGVDESRFKILSEQNHMVTVKFRRTFTGIITITDPMDGFIQDYVKEITSYTFDKSKLHGRIVSLEMLDNFDTETKIRTNNFDNNKNVYIDEAIVLTFGKEHNKETKFRMSVKGRVIGFDRVSVTISDIDGVSVSNLVYANKNGIFATEFDTSNMKEGYFIVYARVYRGKRKIDETFYEGNWLNVFNKRPYYPVLPQYPYDFGTLSVEPIYFVQYMNGFRSRMLEGSDANYYNEHEAYKKGDYVILNDNFYKSLIDENIYNPETNNYLVITEESDPEIFEMDEESEGDYYDIQYSYHYEHRDGVFWEKVDSWDTGKTYSKGDYVLYNNEYYRSLIDNNLEHSVSETEWWEKIFHYTIGKLKDNSFAPEIIWYPNNQDVKYKFKDGNIIEGSDYYKSTWHDIDDELTFIGKGFELLQTDTSDYIIMVSEKYARDNWNIETLGKNKGNYIYTTNYFYFTTIDEYYITAYDDHYFDHLEESEPEEDYWSEPEEITEYIVTFESDREGVTFDVYNTLHDMNYQKVLQHDVMSAVVRDAVTGDIDISGYGEVFFKVNIPGGVVDNVKLQGSYGVLIGEAGTKQKNVYRIARIKGDINVQVFTEDSSEPEIFDESESEYEEYIPIYNVAFTCEHGRVYVDGIEEEVTHTNAIDENGIAQTLLQKNVSFRVVPDNGYDVNGIQINGMYVDMQRDGNSFTISDIRSNLNVIVETVDVVTDMSYTAVFRLTPDMIIENVPGLGYQIRTHKVIITNNGAYTFNGSAPNDTIEIVAGLTDITLYLDYATIGKIDSKSSCLIVTTGSNVNKIECSGTMTIDGSIETNKISGTGYVIKGTSVYNDIDVETMLVTGTLKCSGTGTLRARSLTVDNGTVQIETSNEAINVESLFVGNGTFEIITDDGYAGLNAKDGIIAEHMFIENGMFNVNASGNAFTSNDMQITCAEMIVKAGKSAFSGNVFIGDEKSTDTFTISVVNALHGVSGSLMLKSGILNISSDGYGIEGDCLQYNGNMVIRSSDHGISGDSAQFMGGYTEIWAQTSSHETYPFNVNTLLVEGATVIGCGTGDRDILPVGQKYVTYIGLPYFRNEMISINNIVDDKPTEIKSYIALRQTNYVLFSSPDVNDTTYIIEPIERT